MLILRAWARVACRDIPRQELEGSDPDLSRRGPTKQTNKEIAIGLQDGGFPTTADNFEATVATALYRLKNDGVLLRFPDGRDLASSYPDNLRGRLEKDAAPRKMRAKVRRTRTKPQDGTKAEARKSRPSSHAKRLHKFAALCKGAHCLNVGSLVKGFATLV